MTGASVADCVADLHAALRPATYLEVGTGAADMLAFARGAVAAVGCSARAPSPLGARASLFQHPGPSRAFFSRFDAAQVLGGPIELAFLDGSRRFEMLLRDFIDVERRASPGGVVALPNCIPLNESMTIRDRQEAILRSDAEFPGWWTGDGWKAVALLQRYRPDLSIAAYDATPAGLVVVGNLNPASTVLDAAYVALVQEAASWPSPERLEQYWRDLALISTRSLGRIERVVPGGTAGLRERGAALITEFESLGEDCELGLLQRELGHEPLSLLRFASLGQPAETQLARTVQALRRRFEGLGTAGMVRVDPPDAPPARERMLVESSYNVTYHGFIAADREVSAEAMSDLVAAQPRRLQFLRRKLLENLEDGDKLFVWKSSVAHADAEVRALLRAVRDIGPGWLLWIGPSNAEHLPGEVELVEPGFLRGYVSRFNITNIPILEWCDVAVRAHAIWRLHVPATS